MRDRHPVLDNAVFGLALLLFLVIAYFAVQQLRKPGGGAVEPPRVVEPVSGPPALPPAAAARPPGVDSLPPLKVSKPAKHRSVKKDVPAPR